MRAIVGTVMGVWLRPSPGSLWSILKSCERLGVLIVPGVEVEERLCSHCNRRLAEIGESGVWACENCDNMIGLFLDE